MVKKTGDGEILRWLLLENVPGAFPYTAGTFPFKREGEDPTRMFAGEGDAFRTNRRFKLVSEGMPAKRLSTAFDSVTLYGQDPDLRPDIYGKIGNSGVSIATLDDLEVLYSGFDLCDAATSVSPQPTLEWTGVPWAASYVVEVSTDPTFQGIFYSAVSTTTSHRVQTALAQGVVHYWRVRARNACGFGAFSATWSFTTRDVPPVLLVDDDWDYWGDYQPDYVAFTSDDFFVFPWDYQPVVDDGRFDTDEPPAPPAAKAPARAKPAAKRPAKR